MPNPLLALQVQPAQIDIAGSFQRGQAASADMKTQSLGNMLRQYQLHTAQQDDARANALQGFYQQNGEGIAAGDPEAINNLARIDPSAAQGFQKGAAENQDAKIKTLLTQADFMSRGAQSILDAPPEARPLLYQRLIAQSKDVGLPQDKVPPQYDENVVKQMLSAGMSVKDQVAAHMTEQQRKETERHNKASEADTRRGQNMVDARSKKTSDEAKAPAGYRYKPNGNLEVIPGGPADTTGMRGKATDTQRVTALYADRALESDKILVGHGKDGDKDYVAGVEDELASLSQKGKAAIPGVGNFMVSERFQKADQAKRDFVNAVLRKESGAVISPDEFANADKQYFPQPGDSDAVKAQKRANRKTAINGLRRAAGSAVEPGKTDTVIDFNDLPEN